MDLRFTPEELAFREEVRAFIRDNLPADIRERMQLGTAPRKEDTVRWQRILNEKGWAAYQLAEGMGRAGLDADPAHDLPRREPDRPGARAVRSFNITMIGPVLIQFGTEEQKKRFLPRAANLDDWWCQGFSEPGAGSDLAALKTAAQARRRPLRRQRPEDLDLDRAHGRLVLLPGAHRPERARSGRRASRSC